MVQKVRFFKGVEAISDETVDSGPESTVVVNLVNFAKKTRESRLLMRFFFQKIWKVQELLQRHFQGFFDLIIQKPCASPFSTISGFEFILDGWLWRILGKKLGSQDYSCDFFIPKDLEDSRAPPETFWRIFWSDHGKPFHRANFDHKWFRTSPIMKYQNTNENACFGMGKQLGGPENTFWEILWPILVSW